MTSCKDPEAEMQHVVDVTDAEFEQKVLEESKKRPVVVDFWAPWCGPCRTLGPILEAEVEARDGAILLAKVNTDENPGISQQMGIRGIPAVKAFVDGTLVDEFTGAVPKPAVQDFLGRLKRGPEDDLAKEALALAGGGDLEAADEKAAAALELDPSHTLALVVRGQAAAARGDAGAAEAFLGKAEGDPALADTIDQLRARLAIVRVVQDAGDEPALRQRLEQGDDRDAALGVAAYETLAGRDDEAFERVLGVLQRGGEHKEAAHKLALAILGLVNDEEHKRALRKKLSMALY
jgi:putative thioredoxin